MAKKLMEVTQKLPCLRKGGELPRDEMGILQEISAGLDSSSINHRFDSFTRLATKGEVDQGAFQNLLSTFVPEPLKGVALMSPVLFNLVDMDKNGGISFREVLSGMTMGDSQVSPVSRLKSLLSLVKWTQGPTLNADKASNMLQQVVGLAQDKHTGFSKDAISSLVDMARTGSTVNVNDLAQKLDTLGSVAGNF